MPHGLNASVSCLVELLSTMVTRIATGAHGTVGIAAPAHTRTPLVASPASSPTLPALNDLSEEEQTVAEEQKTMDQSDTDAFEKYGPVVESLTHNSSKKRLRFGAQQV